MNGFELRAALVLMVAAASGVQADTPATATAARGEAIYSRVGCYLCHGYQGQGGAVPGTPGGAGPKIAPEPLPFEAFVHFLRAPRTMPPYSEKVLSDSDIAAIYAYLQSVRPPLPVEQIPALRDLQRVR